MSVAAPPALTIDGEQVPVRLTLGALAEIEDALGADTLSDLARMLANPSVRQILLILPVLIRAAGGAAAVPRISEGTVHLGEAMRVMAHLFRDLMTGEVPGKPNPPGPDGAPG